MKDILSQQCVSQVILNPIKLTRKTNDTVSKQTGHSESVAWMQLCPGQYKPAPLVRVQWDLTQHHGMKLNTSLHLQSSHTLCDAYSRLTPAFLSVDSLYVFGSQILDGFILQFFSPHFILLQVSIDVTF